MMNTIHALHVRFEGVSSSFRFPLIISGTQVSLPVPPYSTILGMISACAGHVITPNDTKIGFEFFSESSDMELERSDRLQLKNGKLKKQEAGIYKRQVYWLPRLDLYITNIALKNIFENPAATPCFGRSQDICWINFVNDVQLHPVVSGKIGATLIPMHMPRKRSVPGIVSRLPEWMDNSNEGFCRTSGPFGIYLAMDSTNKKRFEIESQNLYHPSDMNEGEVIYLHEWEKDGNSGKKLG